MPSCEVFLGHETPCVDQRMLLMIINLEEGRPIGMIVRDRELGPQKELGIGTSLFGIIWSLHLFYKKNKKTIQKITRCLE